MGEGAVEEGGRGADEAFDVSEVLGHGDVLKVVFGWCSTADICAFARVARRWREVALDPAFWTHVDLSGNTHVQRGGCRRVAVPAPWDADASAGADAGAGAGAGTGGRGDQGGEGDGARDAWPYWNARGREDEEGGKVTSLAPSQVNNTSWAIGVLHHARIRAQVQSLHLGGCWPLSDAALAGILCDLPRLTRLALRNVELGRMGAALLSGHECLRQLGSLDGWRSWALEERLDGVPRVPFRDSAMWFVESNTLEHLELAQVLGYCRGLGQIPRRSPEGRGQEQEAPSEQRVISVCSPTLRSVTLDACVADKVTVVCPSLEHLRISEMVALGEAAGPQEEVAAAARYITFTLATCPRLATLELGLGQGASRIPRSVLTSGALFQPSLRRVMLHNLHEFGDTELQHICNGCPSLEELHLSDVPKVTLDIWDDGGAGDEGVDDVTRGVRFEGNRRFDSSSSSSDDEIDESVADVIQRVRARLAGPQVAPHANVVAAYGAPFTNAARGSPAADARGDGASGSAAASENTAPASSRAAWRSRLAMLRQATRKLVPFFLPAPQGMPLPLPPGLGSRLRPDVPHRDDGPFRHLQGRALQEQGVANRVVWPSLRVFSLSGCGVLAAGLGGFFQRCPALDSVLLRCCIFDGHVQAVSQSLRRLHIYRCAVPRLSVSAGALELLSITRCSTLGHVECTSASLARCNFRACRSLGILTLNAPNLRSLVAQGCTRLPDSVICRYLSRTMSALWEEAHPPRSFASDDARAPEEEGEGAADGGEVVNPAVFPGSVVNPLYPASLEEVVVSGSDNMRTFALDNSSVCRLDLADSTRLKVLQLMTPRLAVLDLTGITRLLHADLRSLSVEALDFSACPHLKTLNVASATLKTLCIEGCRELSSFCAEAPALRVLEAPYCASLDGQSLGKVLKTTRGLISLSLRYCDGLEPEALHDFLLADDDGNDGGRGGHGKRKRNGTWSGTLHLLSSLDVSFTRLGSRVDLLCRRFTSLENLDVGGCRGFGDAQALALVAARPAALRSLHVSHCESLSPRGLCALVSAAAVGELPALDKLVANGCEGAIQDEFFALAAAAPSSRKGMGITSLSIVGCALLKDPAFNPADREFHVLSRLTSLNAHYCRRLRSLRLESVPRLEEVQLSANEALENFVLRRCPSLVRLVLRDCPALAPKALEDLIHDRLGASAALPLVDVDVTRCDTLQASLGAADLATSGLFACALVARVHLKSLIVDAEPVNLWPAVQPSSAEEPGGEEGSDVVVDNDVYDEVGENESDDDGFESDDDDDEG